MDTKSKSNKRLGMAISLVLAAVAAAAHILISLPVYGQSRKLATEVNVYESAEFEYDVVSDIIGAYWKLNQSGSERTSPFDLYFGGAEQSLIEYIENYYNESSEYDDTQYMKNLREGINNNVMGMYSSFSSMWEHYRFYLRDDTGQLVYTNESQGLAALLGNSPDQKAMQDLYEFYIVLDFNEHGDMIVRDLYGSPQFNNSAEHYYSEAFENKEYFSGNFYNDFYGEINLPSNFSMVLAVPHGMGNTFEIGSIKMRMQSYNNDDIALIFLVALTVLLAVALVLSRVKRLALHSSTLANVSFEMAVFIIVMLYAIGSMFSMSELFQFNSSTSLDVGSLHIPGNLLMIVYWLLETLCFLIGFYAAASLTQVLDMGLGGYLRRRSWIARACVWLKRKIKSFIAWVIHIDFKDPATKTLLRVVGVNFLVISVLCALWFAGIAGVLIYSVLLFIILRKYYLDLEGKFNTLLEATKRMAEGELDLEVDEDLGLFNPLKEQLSTIREAFSTAVQSETRSQNMKTELITNVSHDLKTPLTAIITYVDLLKDDSIGDEQRREYIDVLDKKSQRLKRLIEDLFEMSKAASGNVSVEYGLVDLPALIKQVESETRDVLDEAGIELVYKIQPEAKQELQLDGEKTSRIFENLLVNIAKYSMPGTRAFVEVSEQNGRIRAELKNVSHDPLDFDAEQITERFIRGDQSRNTEGSGLGLAIAKSFTELQGGSFWIETDADLFKAVVEFKLY